MDSKNSLTWDKFLARESSEAYMRGIREYLYKEKSACRTYYPPDELIYESFRLCPFDRVKVVILGQDPYHGPGQAHGLAFSVLKGTPLPPSLRNIFKELTLEFPEYKKPVHGDLTSWATQGVLLLNTVLTVAAGKPGSHQRIGWHTLTNRAIQLLSDHRNGIVFLLWGNPAQKKADLIDKTRHHVLIAAHPSPLSASRGFFGCGHFQKANEILERQGMKGIDW